MCLSAKACRGGRWDDGMIMDIDQDGGGGQAAMSLPPDVRLCENPFFAFFFTSHCASSSRDTWSRRRDSSTVSVFQSGRPSPPHPPLGEVCFIPSLPAACHAPTQPNAKGKRQGKGKDTRACVQCGIYYRGVPTQKVLWPQACKVRTYIHSSRVVDDRMPG